MPAPFLSSLRQYRRPIVMVAAGFVVLQTLLAGFVTAQAAALTADPFAAVICRGVPSADSEGGIAPVSGKELRLCCVFCTAAAPVLLPGPQPAVASFDLGRESSPRILSRTIIPIDPRAVRAGPSQAPPRRA